MMKLITGIDSKGKIIDKEIWEDGLKHFACKRVTLGCDEEKKKRTIDQNDALWRWDTLLANHNGDTPNDMQYAMLGEIFGWKQIKMGNKIREVPVKTSSQLSTKEFSDYVERYFIKAQELFNYSLPPFGWE